MTDQQAVTDDLQAAQWTEEWWLDFVVNHTTATNPTIWQTSSDLVQCMRSLLNCFWTGQGPCFALAKSADCESQQQQTMNHLVKMCPLTKLQK